ACRERVISVTGAYSDLRATKRLPSVSARATVLTCFTEAAIDMGVDSLNTEFLGQAGRQSGTNIVVGEDLSVQRGGDLIGAQAVTDGLGTQFHRCSEDLCVDPMGHVRT